MRKKLLFIAVMLFIFSGISQAQRPPTKDVKLISTHEFKGYDESVPIKGEIDYRIYYGDQQRKLKKPIIIIDGFDPLDNRSYEYAKEDKPSMYDLMSYTDGGPFTEAIPIIPKLANDHGFDVILVNHPNYERNGKKIDGGADYIERNAMNLITLIQKLNAELKSNGSSEKLVIVGPSMGGQISRYALAYMEKKGWNHNTRLWISVDSPHLGANIPLGLQALLFQLKSKSDEAEVFFDDKLGSNAAKQQLIEQYQHILHVGPNPAYLDGRTVSQGFNGNRGAPFFKRYYDNLFKNGKSGSNGYPMELRKIAIVNGSLTGSKAYDNPFIKKNDNYAGDNGLVLNMQAFSNRTLERPAAINLAGLEANFMPAYGRTGRLLRSFSLGKRTEIFNVTNRNSRGNMDNIPGGWFPSQNDLAEPTRKKTVGEQIEQGGFFEYFGDNMLGGFIDKKWFGGSYWETRTLKHGSSFIPSFSAIGHKNPNQSWAKALNYNLVCTNETPFDSYYGTTKNTQHTSFTKESFDWFLKELGTKKNKPSAQEPHFPVNPNSLVGSSTICDRTTNTYSFNSCKIPGNVADWTLSANLQEVSHTGTSITVRPPNDYRTQGSITATFKNGVTVKKVIWIGRPKTPSYLSGPSKVNTGAIVRYQGRRTAGATSYTWWLPHPFDVVRSVNYSARNWQMTKTTDYNLTAFTGYSKKAGYVQLMGNNKCGNGGAKKIYVTHSSRGGSGGIPLMASIGSFEEDEITSEAGVALYPNPSNRVVNIAIGKASDSGQEQPSRILSVQIVDLSNKMVKNFSTKDKGLTEATIDVTTLPPGGYSAIINTDTGVVIKRMLVE